MVASRLQFTKKRGSSDIYQINYQRIAPLFRCRTNLPPSEDPLARQLPNLGPWEVQGPAASPRKRGCQLRYLDIIVSISTCIYMYIYTYILYIYTYICSIIGIVGYIYIITVNMCIYICIVGGCYWNMMEYVWWNMVGNGIQWEIYNIYIYIYGKK